MFFNRALHTKSVRIQCQSRRPYSMPRSTSGIAVSMAMLLVTLPSSVVFFSAFHRSERENSSWVSAPGLDSDGSEGRQRIFKFSSMYAILHPLHNSRTEDVGAPTHMCLSTSNTFVCCVKLLVRTARLALASVLASSLFVQSQRNPLRSHSQSDDTYSSSTLAPGLRPP